ncbi:phosphodiesterase [Hellea balneolensis]|uniref:phosphodiesterase n=1 Tax=Hellea balneolensis TaxID=287478 RepID=UPI00041EDB0B|nr:phosphodiesterase [Hellea balneolensis]
MLIAQITDLHLTPGETSSCQNIDRLRRVLKHIKDSPHVIDAILITGDLSEGGHPASYKALKTELTLLGIPYYLAMGNHDNAANLAACFPYVKLADGFLNYSINFPDLRFIILDTTLSGRHGGAFCENRADWLDKELGKESSKPTLIAMHHPPADIGIEWMTTREDSPWAKRFKTIIQQHKNVVHIMCGHIHRSIFLSYAGTTLSVAGAVAPQVSLDFSAIDPNKVDGRALVEDSPPSYTLHHWKSGQLTTHHVDIGAAPLIYYDAAHADVIKRTLDRD